MARTRNYSTEFARRQARAQAAGWSGYRQRRYWRAKLTDAEVRRLAEEIGGPVEPERGFVLHTDDYREEATLRVADNISVTATLEILRAIGKGQGPQRSLFALGYAGWAPGQLDAEIQANGWLCVAADQEIVFNPDHDGKWRRALAKLGIDLSTLSSDAGHA